LRCGFSSSSSNGIVFDDLTGEEFAQMRERLVWEDFNELSAQCCRKHWRKLFHLFTRALSGRDLSALLILYRQYETRPTDHHLRRGGRREKVFPGNV
jgi:hypothetical protein